MYHLAMHHFYLSLMCAVLYTSHFDLLFLAIVVATPTSPPEYNLISTPSSSESTDEVVVFGVEVCSFLSDTLL